jgi:glucan 1,3-beta-glucosidase
MASWNDPDYSTLCTTGGNCDALALRIFNSHGVYIYGAGLYSFFDDYSTDCLTGTDCQSIIFDIESSSSIYTYALSTVGTTCMIFRDGKCIAEAADNVSVFPETIAMYQSG